VCTLHFLGNWNLPVAHAFAQYAHIHHEKYEVERFKAGANAIDSHPLKCIRIIDHGSVLQTRGFVIDRMTDVVQDTNIRGQIEEREETSWKHWTM